LHKPGCNKHTKGYQSKANKRGYSLFQDTSFHCEKVCEEDVDCLISEAGVAGTEVGRVIVGEGVAGWLWSFSERSILGLFLVRKASIVFVSKEGFIGDIFIPTS
jgi:hypothetical protein